GGGIYLNSNATLKLGDGVKITGNKGYVPVGDDTSQGGGVWVGSGAKLFIYGTAVIGDNGSHSQAAKNTAFANKAGYGGGIYTWGYVYIGYDSFDESRGTGNPKSCSGGIWYNYAKWGGGIYCANGVAGLPGGTVRMKNGYISYNGSNSNGGGITLAAGANKLSILGGTIANNETAGSGGAILAAKTFELSVRIPSGTATKKNDIFLLIDDTNTPQIKVLSNSLGGSGRILLTGSPTFYNETTPYTALIDSTGELSNVSGACYSFDVADYNSKTWKVDTTGKIKKQ
ncbi:MAG: hypothetical protein J5857_10880, partial [Treponema sp.]|nr:hypothetical protein [Treponema sp.]